MLMSKNWCSLWFFFFSYIETIIISKTCVIKYLKIKDLGVGPSREPTDDIIFCVNVLEHIWWRYIIIKHAYIRYIYINQNFTTNSDYFDIKYE